MNTTTCASKKSTTLLIGLALILALAAAGCGSDSNESATAGATAEATSDPDQVSPAAVAMLEPLATTTGWLVSLSGGNLYPTDLRTGTVQQLTASGLGAAYAGYTGSGADITVYFVELTDRAPDADPSLGNAALWRRRLGDADNNHVFFFRPARSSTDGDALAHAASIAPDGSSFAFADDRGVNRYEAASGVTTLLQNTCQTEPPQSKGCGSYVNPQWSPDGKWILAAKLGFEGSISVVASADGSSSVREFADVGDDVQSWSPDSRYFCAFNELFVPGGVHLVSSVDGSRHPLDARLSQATGTTACTWDAFGKLAVADDSDGKDGADRVAVFQIQPPSDNGAVYALVDPYRDVRGWLPDGSGLIVQGLPACMVCGERPPLVAALPIPGNLLRALPFAAFTRFSDGVVGAIPFAPPADD